MDSQDTAPEMPQVMTVRPLKAGTTEFMVTLPCGILRDGKVHRTVHLRTLTAGDRRLFGDERLQKNPPRLVTKLLMGKIVRIDGIPAVTEGIVRGLLAVDRDALILVLRNETCQNQPFQQDFTCSHCKAKNFVEIPIHEVTGACRDMPDDVRKNVVEGHPAFEVTVPAFGFKGTFAYPDGNLQELILKGTAGGDSTNPFEMQLDILARICLDFNGEGPKPSSDFWAELDIDFVGMLEDEIRKHEYGFVFNPPQTCHRCREETRVRVDSLDFLFRDLRKKAKQ